MIARSRQIDWIELNNPIHTQPQMIVNTPFLVSLYALNI